MPLIRTVFATAVLVCLLSLSTRAQTQVAVGNLTCTGGAGVGLILGSQKSYQCSFTPIDGGSAERYEAAITKIGFDVGVTDNAIMVWSVLSAGGQLNRGFLIGDYAGVAGDAAIGVGGGAKVLVGGSSKSIVLQPLSVQAQTGINLAVGITGMTIR